MYTGKFPDAGVPAAGLLEARPPLTGWYATPLDRDRLTGLQLAAEAGLQRSRCRGTPEFGPQLLRLVCRSLGGADVSGEYHRLARTGPGTREAALLELVYGQLLVCRKRLPATTHLERGCIQAAGFLETCDYFGLVRRHETLGYLALTECAGEPLPLHALLTEGAVIRRLRAGRRCVTEHAHHDTVG